MKEEDFLIECYKFLDHFGVDYSSDVIEGDSGGNSCIMRVDSEFAELFGGMSINSVAKYVAEKTGKKFIYIRDEKD